MVTRRGSEPSDRQLLVMARDPVCVEERWDREEVVREPCVRPSDWQRHSCRIRRHVRTIIVTREANQAGADGATGIQGDASRDQGYKCTDAHHDCD